MDFDWSVIWKSREVLWDGMKLSLLLFGIALAGGIFFGTLLAMARLSSWKILSYPSAAFVNTSICPTEPPRSFRGNGSGSVAAPQRATRARAAAYASRRARASTPGRGTT